MERGKRRKRLKDRNGGHRFKMAVRGGQLLIAMCSCLRNRMGSLDQSENSPEF
jgi:hypothetical protein